MLRRAAETAVAAALPVVVVTGALYAELPKLAGLSLLPVRCQRWVLSMGASLKAGLAILESVSGALSAVMVILCDQTPVTLALLVELVITVRNSSWSIIATQYGDIRGVPMLFEARAIALLRDIADAAGTAQLLRQHPERVATVPFEGGAVDVDTPAQYAALLAGRVYFGGDAAHVHAGIGTRDMNLGIKDDYVFAQCYRTGQRHRYHAARHAVVTAWGPRACAASAGRCCPGPFRS